MFHIWFFSHGLVTWRLRDLDKKTVCIVLRKRQDISTVYFHSPSPPCEQLILTTWFLQYYSWPFLTSIIPQFLSWIVWFCLTWPLANEFWNVADLKMQLFVMYYSWSLGKQVLGCRQLEELLQLFVMYYSWSLANEFWNVADLKSFCSCLWCITLDVWQVLECRRLELLQLFVIILDLFLCSLVYSNKAFVLTTCLPLCRRPHKLKEIPCVLAGFLVIALDCQWYLK